MVAVVWLTYWLTRRQYRRHRDTPSDAEKLFTDLLDRLSVGTLHRRRLMMLARDLELEHPATMLFSPRVLDRCLDRWLERRPPNEADRRTLAAFAEEIKPVLFPENASSAPPEQPSADDAEAQTRNAENDTAGSERATPAAR